MNTDVPKVGIALDSGGAMGGAHIGVLEELHEQGIPLDIIVGSSAGAAIGALYIIGKLDTLKEIITDLSLLESLRFYVDPVIPVSGLLEGKRARKFLHTLMGDVRIEDLPSAFVAVATDLLTGETVPITRGPLVDAVLASSSIPGIFKPVVCGGRLLTDGGVADPLPLDVLSSFSPDITIACNLHAKIGGQYSSIQQKKILDAEKMSRGQEQDLGSWMIDRFIAVIRNQTILNGVQPLLLNLAKKLNISRFEDLGESDLISALHDQLLTSREKIAAFIENSFAQDPGIDTLNIFEIIAQATNIQQYQKNRLMLAHEKPDVLIEPDVRGVSSLDFSKAASLIEEGRTKTREALPGIRTLLEERKKTTSRA